jgi:hypothetical protein
MSRARRRQFLIKWRNGMKSDKWFLAVSLATLCAGSPFAGGRFISPALLDHIRPGVTTELQVRELLGQSVHIVDYAARGQHELEYEARDYGDPLVIWISVGNDGIVRDISRMKRGKL